MLNAFISQKRAACSRMLLKTSTGIELCQWKEVNTCHTSAEIQDKSKPFGISVVDRSDLSVTCHVM